MHALDSQNRVKILGNRNKELSPQNSNVLGTSRGRFRVLRRENAVQIKLNETFISTKSSNFAVFHLMTEKLPLLTDLHQTILL